MTRSEALKDATQRLAAADIDNAGREAAFLVASLLEGGLSALRLGSEVPLSHDEEALYLAYLERRCRREPLSRILGQREFWSLPFKVTPHVLDPRADSETLVDAVLARLPGCNEELRILDLGTGSGCLLLALLSELPRARGLGLDLSPKALAVARENAQSLDLSDRCEFAEGGWHCDIAGRWDLIVANPPYIESEQISQLMPEVREHDPRGALDGGPDGLDAYRQIAERVPRVLAFDGLLALEIGSSQGAAVRKLLHDQGLLVHSPVCDLGGLERVILAKHAKK